MEQLEIPDGLENNGRLVVFGRLTGKDLNTHFDWSDLVVSPGNVGLLVMNAARHGKGIVIDDNSYHGPEYWLAKESGQPFISFCDMQEVNRFINDVIDNRWKLQHWGRQLQEVAKEKYTIEYMAEAHYRVFEKVAESGKTEGGGL
jgi:glycosyltransferase involved in cell wall biosynthesis